MVAPVVMQNEGGLWGSHSLLACWLLHCAVFYLSAEVVGPFLTPEFVERMGPFGSASVQTDASAVSWSRVAGF